MCAVLVKASQITGHEYIVFGDGDFDRCEHISHRRSDGWRNARSFGSWEADFVFDCLDGEGSVALIGDVIVQNRYIKGVAVTGGQLGFIGNRSVVVTCDSSVGKIGEVHANIKLSETVCSIQGDTKST